MPGSFTRYQIQQNLASCFLANGNEFAYRIVEEAGFVAWTAYVRYKYSDGSMDPAFTPVAGGLIGSEDDLSQSIVASGGFWNTTNGLPAGSPTWQQIASGAIYVSPIDGHSYSGSRGVDRAMGDFLSQNTAAVCEQATDVAFFKNTVLAEIQSVVDLVSGSINVNPAPPPGPLTPQQQVPPQAKVIVSGTGLLDAHATRVAVSIDPLNLNRPVVGAIPVPQ